jgi:translocation and assembly module TamA
MDRLDSGPLPLLSSIRLPWHFSSPLLLAPLLAVALSTFAAPATAALGDWWPFGRKTESEPIPDPLPYTTSLTVTGGDSRIEKALRNASGLIENQATPASGLIGLIARARQDVARLTAALYENARYAGQIAITVDGKPLETIGPFDPVATRPVPVAITVSSGPAFTFGRIEATPLPLDVTLQKLGLVTAKPAESSIIVNAETAIANGWRQQGHPLVVVNPRDVVADHASAALDVTLHVDPGPTANFGRVSVTGTDAVDAGLVLRRAGIEPEPYTSKKTKRAETRLRDLGPFDSVRVVPAEKLDADGTIPIAITVTERKKHVIGGTASYSNTEGAGIEVYWRHRNLWGGAEQLQFTAAVSRLASGGTLDPDYRLATSLKKPAIFDAMTDGTLRLEGYRQTTDAYRVTAVESEAGLAHIFSDTLSGSLGLNLTRSRTIDALTTANHVLATLPAKIDWDARDNRLDPVEGFRAQFLVAPAHDFRNGASFTTFSADVAFYRTSGASDRLIYAGRVAGMVLAANNVLDVAAERRIYAGGAGSIRGYGYKNVAPRNGNGDIIGGRSSLVASGEIRYRLNDQYGLVGFTDAGNAYASQLPGSGGMKVGIGAGVRYHTPVGPIRFDVARALQRGPGDPAVAIYVGLGQAF